ncbi:unnamed protein product [Sphenostylis stenocarpa]|uniref:Uncharacterized protein n=1 Tax=Sphenostylis stenocarpa TaxID=92480 RepID=A0AA86SF87_9FABA|nr:unnamed protein product [Sphenostylis stenocarpa]
MHTKKVTKQRFYTSHINEASQRRTIDVRNLVDTFEEDNKNEKNGKEGKEREEERGGFCGVRGRQVSAGKGTRGFPFCVVIALSAVSHSRASYSGPHPRAHCHLAIPSASFSTFLLFSDSSKLQTVYTASSFVPVCADGERGQRRFPHRFLSVYDMIPENECLRPKVTNRIRPKQLSVAENS